MWLSDSTYKDSGGFIRRLPMYNASDWNYMCFDAGGRATEDFDCVVAGFGQHGQDDQDFALLSGVIGKCPQGL